MNRRKKIVITMGDPAGIGAEIIIKALSHSEVYEKCIPIVIGDYEVLSDAVNFCESPLKLIEIKNINESKGEFKSIEYIDLKKIGNQGWKYKCANAQCGEAAFSYIMRAISEAMSGNVDAIVTAPISKDALNMAGHIYSGHTEILADYTGTTNYAMLLMDGKLRVIHISTHCSLKEACNRVKKERVLDVIRLADKAMMQFGICKPKIGVAGLNPHSSENGLFGTEEELEIIPAIKLAQNEGINVTGPEPADTIFVKCLSGIFDIVVAMYHDQGHIPIKLKGFELNAEKNAYESVKGINCTIGLPIIRTSVDHGTAYGKAGEGRANEESMLEAIDAAVTMALNKTNRNEENFDG